MDIYSEFKEFQVVNKKYLEKLDGLNGDCKIYSMLLSDYLNEKGYSTIIGCLNYGVHYWVELDGVAIDCRGIFLRKENVYKDFLKYVKKPKIIYNK